MGDGNLRFMTHLVHEFGMPYRRPYIIGPFAVFVFSPVVTLPRDGQALQIELKENSIQSCDCRVVI
jgi:hypothetical protein